VTNVVWTAVASGRTATATEKVDVRATLYGTNGVTLGDRSVAQKPPAGTLGALVNGGAVQTMLGVSARSGDIISKGPVSLSSNAFVGGSVKSGGAVTRQAGATVQGTISQNVANLAVPAAPAFETVTFPGGAIVSVVKNQTTSINPGGFSSVTVNGGGTLQLKTGRYLMNSFDVESGAKVVLNSSAGPVEIFVKTTIIYRGQFSDVTGKPENLRITFLGTSAAFLEASFLGRFSAPNAAVTLGGATNQTFQGLFFGKSIAARADVKVGCQATLSEGAALAERKNTAGAGCACTTSPGMGESGGRGLGATGLGVLALAALAGRRRRRARRSGE
jgi:MYXO-CTERM domain-containing protein